MPESKSKIDAQTTIEFQVHLIEYQKLRDEIVHRIESASQTLFLSLSSSSVILPILFTQADKIPTIALGLFLHVLSIIYAVIGMHYSTSLYYVSSIGDYVHQSLAPKMNLRLNTSTKNRVLQSEDFLRNTRRNFISLYLSSIGTIATGLVILMPSLLFLLFAQYVFALPSAQISQSATSFHFLGSWILPLDITAWMFFILSVLSQMLSMVYAVKTIFIKDDSGR